MSIVPELGRSTRIERRSVPVREVSRFGEFQQVDWIFGLQAPSTALDLVPAADVAEWQWSLFPTVYDRLDSDVNRRAVMRLQTLLAG